MENISISKQPDKCYIVITCDKDTNEPVHIESIGFENGGEEEVLKLLASTVISPKAES